MGAFSPKLPAHDDGFALHLSREEWDAVVDGLILERERSLRRQAVNSASTSGVRAAMCAELITRIRRITRIRSAALAEFEAGRDG